MRHTISGVVLLGSKSVGFGRLQIADASTQKALQALGATIREERLRRKISQEKLAEFADVHANYIGRVERAEINVSFDTLHRIARALGLSLSELAALAGI